MLGCTTETTWRYARVPVTREKGSTPRGCDRAPDAFGTPSVALGLAPGVLSAEALGRLASR